MFSPGFQEHVLQSEILVRNMTDDQKKQLRAKLVVYFQSEEFNKYFEQLHSPGWILWPVAIIAPLTIIGWGIGRQTWKQILSGDMESRKLRERYSKLARDGDIILTYVVIANQTLKYQEGANGPALVVGNFNDGRDDGKILNMVGTLARLALGKSSDGKFEETSKLLSDLDYTFKRRRRIPGEIAGDAEVYAFDLKILGDFLPTKTLKIDAIPCIAEPGPNGLICAIPSKLIMAALGGDRSADVPEADANEQDDADAVKQLSHEFIPDSLQNDRERFCGALLSGKGSEVLTRTAEFLFEQMGSGRVPGEVIVEPMRQNEFLLALITFPETKRDGDAHLGLIILGPRQGWDRPNFETMPYRYFILERGSELQDGHLTRIIDFSHLEYLDCHMGCEVDARNFVDTILKDVMKIIDN